MGVTAEARKSILFLRPGTVASADRARSLIILQTPTKNVQELAKEKGEENEAKLREAIEMLEGVVSAIVGSWRDLEGDFLGVLILYFGSEFALGRPQQVETNSGAPAFSSSSLPASSIRA